MTDLDAVAAALHQQLDESLALAVHDECERVLALARLGQALEAVIRAIGHPALRFETAPNGAGHTSTVRLLDRVIMRWCFAHDRVDVYCRDFDGSMSQVRMRYAAHAREWRLAVPGSRPCAGSFADEEEKVCEMIEDALGACAPWVNPKSLSGLS